MPRRESARIIAARAVAAVLAGHSLDPLLRNHVEGLSARDRALARELATGAVRYFYSLRAELHAALNAPLKQRDQDVMALLLVGAYQLRHTRIPSHAAVHATVEAARALDKPWAVRLTNAILRRLQRERADVSEDDEEAHYDHPQWMIDALRDEYPEDFEDVLGCNLTRAPMALRINRRRNSRAEYLRRLTAQHVSAHPGEQTETAVILHAPCPSESLPGAEEGAFMVQDEGAQLAATLLAPDNSHRVLDACAAPGGKACHLAELAPEATLVLVEADVDRARQLADVVEQHAMRCKIHNAHAEALSDWWDGREFDRILLDAPCTASGAVRRHPDIRLLRRPSDADNLAATQRLLLCRLWQTLKPDGLLLYCTCSLFHAENDGVISTFLEQTPDAVIESVPLTSGKPTVTGRQLLPSENANDGFFFSLLRKSRLGRRADADQTVAHRR
ncbi:MAG: 16S rRNA (cytosine(967)-C(5))-methyltransferase RsmB [Pseudomonadales bacterium]